MANSGRIDAKTQVCAVIGNPVNHSLSPAIHNAAIEALGLDFVYVAFRVEDVKSALSGMRALVVDDNDQAREILANLLGIFSMDVTAVNSGEKAIEGVGVFDKGRGVRDVHRAGKTVSRIVHRRLVYHQFTLFNLQLYASCTMNA